MNERKIILRSYSDTDSLKRLILQKLNLVDHKKDPVLEFDERVKSYIERNKNSKLVLQYDKDKLVKELDFNLTLASRAGQRYPDNFELGNPHNRWQFDPVVKTEEQAQQEKRELKKLLQDKLTELNSFLDQFRQLGEGQIEIQEY
ncbi:MAG: hypothetical protein NT150_08085 [Bacteroidetes bacterium]|nr:hypothetical protein [Bacteroidota bacterium]